MTGFFGGYLGPAFPPPSGGGGGITVGTTPINSGYEGCVLFQNQSGVVAEDRVNFTYTPAGQTYGPLGTSTTLYVGGYAGFTSSGTLALWDNVSTIWQSLSPSDGLLTFSGGAIQCNSGAFLYDGPGNLGPLAQENTLYLNPGYLAWGDVDQVDNPGGFINQAYNNGSVQFQVQSGSNFNMFEIGKDFAYDDSGAFGPNGTPATQYYGISRTTQGQIALFDITAAEFLTLSFNNGQAYLGGLILPSGQGTIGQSLTSGGSGQPAVWASVPLVRFSGTTSATNGAAVGVGHYTLGSTTELLMVYCNINITASTAFSFQIIVSYTDVHSNTHTVPMTFTDASGVQWTTLTNANGVGTYSAFSMMFNCKASTSLTIGTASGGTFTGVSYDVSTVIVSNQ
jgi:hypothetical protein